MKKKFLIALSTLAMLCGFAVNKTVENNNEPVVAEAVNHTGGHIYFERPSTWKEAKVSLFVGHDSWTEVKEMSLVKNTENIYYVKMGSWSGANYCCFAGTGTLWGTGSWGSSNRTNAPEYTNTSPQQFNNSNYTYFFKASTDKKQGSNISCTKSEIASNSFNILNEDKYVYSYLFNSATNSYEENDAAGTVSVKGYGFTNHNTVTEVSGDHIRALPGKQMTYTVEPKKGYNFVGWSKDKENTLSTTKTYGSNETTLYALFEEIKHTVTFVVDGENYSVSIREGQTIGDALNEVELPTNVKITGWDKDLNSEVTEDVTVTADIVVACSVTFNVNGKNYSIAATKGQTIQEALNDVELPKEITVVEWDTTTSTIINGDITVKATKYYTAQDRPQAKLGFSYSYTGKDVNTLVVFQCPSLYGETVYVTATNDLGDKEIIEMHWNADCSDGWKKEWVVSVPSKYTYLKFDWGTNAGGTNSNVTQEFTRDFVDNAFWYNASDSWGRFPFLSTLTKDNEVFNKTEEIIETINVSDMRMAINSGAIDTTGFVGVENYGIRIEKEGLAEPKYLTWSPEEITKVNENNEVDPDGTYIAWGFNLNNIPKESYNEEFAVTYFVEINGTNYDICETRTISVVSLANEYLSLTDGIAYTLCNFVATEYAIAE